MPSAADPILLPIDWTLIHGFDFICRPDCGLCCYTSPALTPKERTSLLQLLPELPILGGPGGRAFIGSRPAGGACALLSSERCGAHSMRPSPCRRFPLDVHIGDRIQVSLVLSCPGLSLAGLRGPRMEAKPPSFPSGLRNEIDAVKEWIGEAGFASQVQRARARRRTILRRLSKEGIWEDEDAVRVRLRGSIPFPDERDFPSDPPPTISDGLELLPLYFDEQFGRVALAEAPGGCEVVSLGEGGGVVQHLGVYPPPDSPPRLDTGARELLESYLRYFLERDFLFGAVHVTLLEDPTTSVGEAIANELRSIGADVVTRAMIRAKIGGRSGDPLSEPDIENGLRAVDMDRLDRPSWGNPP